LDKPTDVFDRNAEWADLADFVFSPLPGLRIAVVYGRRRQGKSYLLRRLADAVGGLYHLATEQAELVSLRRFGDSLAAWAGLPAGAFGFGGWEQALRTAADVLAARSSPQASGSVPALLVLDEFPYLVQETPGLPSIVQSLYDTIGPGAGPGSASLRLILCGSAISVMGELLSGTRALRGRAALELRVRSFGYREAREFWGIGNVTAAFAHSAVVGGTPGYRELVLDPRVPDDLGQLGSWLARNVLRPSMPLFDEARRVVHEDPRIRDTAAYSSVLAAVAAGESSPTKIGGLLGRPATSLAHQLSTLASAGFIDRRHDLLLDRRPVISVADPMVRFHQLVIEPYLADLEAGRARQVWAEAENTVESKIFGPHFEALAAEWIARYASTEAGLTVGPVGQTVIACREHQAGHKIDVLALARGARPRTPGTPVAFIGEAKHRDRRPGIAELRRLEHLRDLLTAAGHDATDAVFGVFSASGFTDELMAEETASQGKLLLTDLDILYGQPALSSHVPSSCRSGGRNTSSRESGPGRYASGMRRGEFRSLRRAWTLGLPLVLVVAVIGCTTSARPSAARVTVQPGMSVADQPVRIRVTGLAAGQDATVRMSSTDAAGVRWASSATYHADATGGIDLNRAPALSGDYGGVSGMGLIWSMRPTGSDPLGAYFWGLTPRVFTVSVSLKTGQVASAVFQRTLSLVPLVQPKESLSADGFVGQYWRPETTTVRRPAILVLGGSEGGLPVLLPALLASSGYPALSIAYFKEPGLPQTLSRIPLEYFAKALTWLARQPGVDPRHIAVLGISRGSEAAQLLGVYYPALVHAVIASVPSDAAICSYPGCGGPAWTLHGQALPYTSDFDNPYPADDPAAVIPDQRINGPVFLDCAEADQTWTSCPYAQAISKLLDDHHDHWAHVLYEYPGAGHFVGSLIPYEPYGSAVVTAPDAAYQVNQEADAQLWPHLLSFLASLVT